MIDSPDTLTDKMATVMTPVELPTGRRSYLNTAPSVDIHDPNWIPMLGGATFQPPSPSVEKEVALFQPANSSSASFSLFPNQPASPKPVSPKPQPAFSHNYSKSSLAPESIASDSRSQSPHEGIEPVPQISEAVKAGLPGHPERAGHHRRPTSRGGASIEEKISIRTETPGGDIASQPSTDGTASVVGENSSNPENLIDESIISPSSRSSMTSTRRAPVFLPTSKYNRKPISSMANSIGRPSFMPPSLPQTPTDSPRLSPSVPAAIALPYSNSTGHLPASPRMIPLDHPLPPPDPPESSTPKLGPMKSTASERRGRALHSHPSNISLKSRRNSSSDEAEIKPKPPSVRYKPRKSTESRPTTPRSIYDSQNPTPAPTGPLPQLPPQARKPSTRSLGPRKSPQIPQNETPVPSFANFRPSEHSEMASFMTSENTVIFRRFDDVHVRLLLTLQDEISQLEKEILELENPNSAGTASEKLLQRTRVLRELRKVVAEYGTFPPR